MTTRQLAFSRSLFAMLTREGGPFISISAQAPLKPPLPGRETPLQKSDTDRSEWGERRRRSLVQDMRSQCCRGKVIRMAPTYSSACPPQWSLGKHAAIINTRITGLLNACPPQQLDAWNKVNMKHNWNLLFQCLDGYIGVHLHFIYIISP